MQNGEQADSQKITTDWPKDLSPITFRRLPFASLREIFFAFIRSGSTELAEVLPAIALYAT
jgi:hypothetical protein